MKKFDFNTAFNTLKISCAAIVAIYISHILTLENAFSAGIVAILTIQPTKKETIKTALDRFLAFIFALIIAYISYTLVGFNMYGFFVYLIIFVFICQYKHWISAIAMNSVIILHFCTFKNMNLNTILAESAIFLIGIFAGIIANMHLHKNTHKIQLMVNSIDSQIQQILQRMSEKLLKSDKSDYNSNCFIKLSQCLNLAEQQAKQNFQNQIVKNDYFDIEYINMRRKQEFVLIEMYKNVRQLEETPQTIYAVSTFIKNIAMSYEKTNNASSLLNKLNELEHSMKNTNLPKTRKEFENRARLYILLQQIREFLTIKLQFIKIQNRN
ncbi:MAG: aromatic acid exporter family protein [Succinivibrionaceae bacterium]